MRQCPQCKSDEFSNRQLALLVNECGHSLCQNCVDSLFVCGVNKCPASGCSRNLKKSGFWPQLFDDPAIEREVHIRKRLTKTYNLQADDFPSMDAYNDYLEHVEDLVFRLLAAADQESTSGCVGEQTAAAVIDAEIKRFKAEHRDAIERNQRRPDPDDLWIAKMLEEEELRARRLRDEAGLEANQQQQNTLFDTKSIIKELRDSDLPAEIVLDRKRKLQIEAEMVEKEAQEQRKRDKHERLLQAKREKATFGMPVRVSGEPYLHTAVQLLTQQQLNGPRVPPIEELVESGYLQHVCMPSSADVGGLTALVALRRMLTESRVDLFFASSNTAHA